MEKQVAEGGAAMGRGALELVPAARQEQVLSPQLRASLRVLQLDAPALEREIRREAEQNPVVEVADPDAMTTVSDELRAREQADTAEFEADGADGMDYSTSLDEEAAERRQRFFDSQVASESLQEHLLAQVAAASFTPEEAELAELIVGDVDDAGYYVGSFDDLASVTGVSAETFARVLGRVQAFDPPGVAGRTLRECLTIQARQADANPRLKALLERIIDRGLALVAQGDMAGLATRLDTDRSAVDEAVRLLRTLEPRPGRPFVANGRHPQFIRPEVEVEMFNGSLTLTSVESALPTLTIDLNYRAMAESEETPAETRRYLRARIASAELLQEAVHRRGETVLKVAEAVFRAQRDFFTKGFAALRPLTIEQIAAQTGYHGTTVGRAVRGKYVRTPRGVFELSRFFCVGRLADATGRETVSSVAVKCRLTDLVHAETTSSLTDEDLARELSRGGTPISRRTVAKYRAALGIPSAAERQKRRTLA